MFLRVVGDVDPYNLIKGGSSGTSTPTILLKTGGRRYYGLPKMKRKRKRKGIREEGKEKRKEQAGLAPFIVAGKGLSRWMPLG
jgi:hypothetical protein